MQTHNYISDIYISIWNHVFLWKKQKKTKNIIQKIIFVFIWCWCNKKSNFGFRPKYYIVRNKFAALINWSTKNLKIINLTL